MPQVPQQGMLLLTPQEQLKFKQRFQAEFSFEFTQMLTIVLFRNFLKGEVFFKFQQEGKNPTPEEMNQYKEEMVDKLIKDFKDQLLPMVISRLPVQQKAQLEKVATETMKEVSNLFKQALMAGN